MDKAQLVAGGFRNHEWVKIRMAHAAAKAVERYRKRQPTSEQAVEILTLVDVVDGNERFPLWLRLHVLGRGRIQGFQHVEVMRPGFRPILPWVSAGVSRDVPKLPVGRSPVRVMAR